MHHAWLLPQRSIVTRDAHSAADCRCHALFMTKPSEVPSRTERARVALACAWMQLLRLRKTATSPGCKYDVLRGGRKHSTTCGKAAFMSVSLHMSVYLHMSLFSHVSRFFFFFLLHIFLCLFLLTIDLSLSLSFHLSPNDDDNDHSSTQHNTRRECVGLGPSLVGELLASCRN